MNEFSYSFLLKLFAVFSFRIKDSKIQKKIFLIQDNRNSTCLILFLVT